MTLNAGAVLAAGPTAAMKKEEHNLIETGMVSLANQYPDKFIAGGNALGPGMLAVGCLMWIGRIIRDKRSAESIAASLPNPLAENWQGQQTAAQQPEWEPNPPAVRVANVGGASLPIETPQPNGAQYEGESDYGWIGRITSMG